MKAPPYEDRWTFTKGGLFVRYYPVNQADPFPPGSTATAYIYNHDHGETLGLWGADVDAGGALFTIDAADTDDIPDGSRFRIYVSYPGIPGQLPWWRGSVIRSE